MPYCEKCGNIMSDDAVFCSKCGRKAELNIVSEQAEASTTVTDGYQSVINEAMEEEECQSKPKKLNKRIIALTAILLSMVVIGFFLFFVLHKDDVVIENEDGDTVFAFTLTEFIDRYNDENLDVLRFRDFEKNIGGDSYDLDEDEYSLYVGIDKGNDPCNVTSISLFIYDDGKVPDEAVGIMRAIFTDMTEEEAYDHLKDVLSEGWIETDNVRISVEETSWGELWWKFEPSWFIN